MESDPLAEEEGGSVRNAGQKLPLLSTEQLDMESSLSRTNNKPDNEILGRRKYLNELHKLKAKKPVSNRVVCWILFKKFRVKHGFVAENCFKTYQQ